MREKMITRTIASAKVDVLVCDMDTASTETLCFTTKPEPDHNKLLRRLKKEHETESVKLVGIIGYEEEEKLYGMPESQFMAIATELPPRGTKADDETESL